MADEKLKPSHLDEHGAARMVDVGDKETTRRTATAEGWIRMEKDTLAAIQQNTVQKGDVLTVAKIAGISAAKKTADWIPLCHPLNLAHISVTLSLSDNPPSVLIEARVKTNGQTGVEMEALTAVSVAALTIYDMAKAADRTMRIEAVRLSEKHGGQSGEIILED